MKTHDTPNSIVFLYRYYGFRIRRWYKRHGFLSVKTIGMLIVLTGLNLSGSAQMTPGYLSQKATIGKNPTVLNGSLIIGKSGELFFGSHKPHLQQINTLFHIGNYEGKLGARIYLSVLNNSNTYGSRGFMDVVGTAGGSTEIILDMFDNWDGSRIDLVRAHNKGSNINAFTMQDEYYNRRLAQLKSRVEGGDRIWYVEELPEDCLPIILQKKNKTLVVDNNAMNNGGYNFGYYKWYKNDLLIHEGTYGTGLGGIYNTGKTVDLSPYDTYYALVIDQYGMEHRTCPYNPTVFLYETRITAYPNPTTINQSLVAVDVETDDIELLANGIIISYDLLGRQLQQVRTNGHRITPVQLPPVAGTYLLRFVSGDYTEVIKVIIN